LPRGRAVRLIRSAVVALLGTIALLVLAASVVLQGPTLGRLITKLLPENRGKLQIGGVTWRLRALVDLVTDAPSPITIDGLRILDPEGTIVLDVPHVEAKVKLRTLIGGSFSIHDLRAPVAQWRFAQMASDNGIGFLAALEPKKTAKPKPRAEKPKGPGSFFELVDAELGDLNVLFDFPGSWGLELRHVHARASLKQSGVDPANPTFGFDAGPVVAAGGGWLRILDDNLLPFDRVSINRVATTPEAPDDILLDLDEATTGRSKLVGKGVFTGIYGATSIPGIKLHVDYTEAADALQAVVAGKQIEGLTLSGEGTTVVADLHDTFAKLKVAASFRGLDARFDSYRALGIGFNLGFDAEANKVDLEKFSFGAPGGGKLKLDAHLDITKMGLAATLGFAGFHTESYVPPPLRTLAGGQLDGRVVARGDLKRLSVRLPDVDLKFMRARASGLPRDVRIHGNGQLAAGRVQTDGLTVSVAGANATAKGAVDFERKLVEMGLAVVADDLSRLLASLELPPLAHDARIDLQAKGALENPDVNGTAIVRGVNAAGRTLPELESKFGLEKGVARMGFITGAAFGGRIQGQGTLRLWEKRSSRPLRSPILDVKLDARDIDLAKVLQHPDLGGRLTMHAEAHGPLDAIGAQLTVPADTPITLLGESYALGPVDIGFDGRIATIRTLHVGRKAGGGLDVTGTFDPNRQAMDLQIRLDRVPLAGLPGIAEAGVPVSGVVSANLHVSGTPKRPELGGTIDLADVAVRGVALGAGHLTLTPFVVPGGGGAPGVAVAGRLFDRFDIDARAALLPKGPSVHGQVSFRRVELEALAPELAELGDGRGVASGEVKIDLEPGQPLALDVLIPELWLSVARTLTGPNGEPTVQRVRVDAVRPIHVNMHGDRIVLDETRFSTTGGELQVGGRLEGKEIAAKLSGRLTLELLQPFLAGAGIERLTGDLAVEVTAAGTTDRPSLRGQVAISTPVRLRLADFDRDFVVGSGKVTLDTSGAAVENLVVVVDGAAMRVSGHAGLGPGFVPTDVQADVDGDVSARLLAVVAPDAVSDARGRAHVRAQLRGTLTKPEIKGRIDLGTIDCRLRDLGAQVQVQSGIVELNNEGAILHNVRVVVDGQGVLVIGASGVRAGRVQFESLVPFKPGEIDLPLHGEQLSYRSPEVFIADDVAFDLDLMGSVDDGFELGGEVRLVSGRYVQDFKVTNMVISRRVNESSVRPFYDGKPLLEGLGLDLSIRTVGEGFVVQNNIAPEIHLDILLHVGGTLARPVIAGDVRPTDGRFNIPFMRGDFDLVANVNHVTFIASKSLEEGDTPELNVEATNTVTDAGGTDHNVRMRIRGPVREAQMELWTEDGLDRNQTALLLLTGRTGSESSRLSTQNPTVGGNIGTAADVAGQATRDTVASLMEPYIGESFYRLTGLKLRLTVGSDGFQGRVRKSISRRLNFQTDYLQGFQNSSKWTTQFALLFADYLTFAWSAEQIRLSASQQGMAETLPVNQSFELRLDYAIRR
jgi:hypothetical protein